MTRSDLIPIRVISDGLRDAMALRSWELVARYVAKLEMIRAEPAPAVEEQKRNAASDPHDWTVDP